MRFAHKLKKSLFLAAFLFGIIALPTLFVEKVRIKFMSLLHPCSKSMLMLTNSNIKDDKYKSLEIENQILKNELAKNRVISSMKNSTLLPAHVIYRDPSSWSSSLWINVGESSNTNGKLLIKKNSPVLYGNAVVGVVEYVGKAQSRVRLITDLSLKISVRALRGTAQNALLLEHIEAIQMALKEQKQWPISVQEVAFLLKKLEQIRQYYQQSRMTWYLAKGMIQGSGHPLWRKKTILKGFGFNYDFEDIEGPPRDLDSGKTQNFLPDLNEDSYPKALIQINDLLVTTGFDGIFPPGLKVAIVTKVFPLKEGAYTYDIEAKPIAFNIDELKTVFVLPSLEFEEN